jgi:hypothetical protein
MLHGFLEGHSEHGFEEVAAVKQYTFVQHQFLNRVLATNL